MANYCDCTIFMDCTPEEREEVRDLLRKFTRLHGGRSEISVTHFSEIVGKPLDRDWGWDEPPCWKRAVWKGVLKWDPPLDFVEWLSLQYQTARVTARFHREYVDQFHEVDFVNGEVTYERFGPFKVCPDDSPLLHHRRVYFDLHDWSETRAVERLMYESGVAFGLEFFTATRMSADALLDWVNQRYRGREIQLKGVEGYMVDEDVVLRELLDERRDGWADPEIDALPFLPSLHLRGRHRVDHPAMHYFLEQIERDIELSREELLVVASLLSREVITDVGAFRPHLFSRFEILRNTLGRQLCDELLHRRIAETANTDFVPDEPRWEFEVSLLDRWLQQPEETSRGSGYDRTFRPIQCELEMLLNGDHELRLAAARQSELREAVWSPPYLTDPDRQVFLGEWEAVEFMEREPCSPRPPKELDQIETFDDYFERLHDASVNPKAD